MESLGWAARAHVGFGWGQQQWGGQCSHCRRVGIIHHMHGNSVATQRSVAPLPSLDVRSLFIIPPSHPHPSSLLMHSSILFFGPKPCPTLSCTTPWSLHSPHFFCHHCCCPAGHHCCHHRYSFDMRLYLQMDPSY